MINSKRRAGRGAQLVGVVVAVVASVSLSGSEASAQVGGDAVVAPSPYVSLPGSAQLSTGRGLRRSLDTFDYRGMVVSRRTLAPAFTASSAGRHRSTGRKVLGGVIGAVGGLFAGAYIGAAIEGKGCGCDDPGLKGALIGAPVGAVVGAALGAAFF